MKSFGCLATSRRKLARILCVSLSRYVPATLREAASAGFASCITEARADNPISTTTHNETEARKTRTPMVYREKQTQDIPRRMYAYPLI